MSGSCLTIKAQGRNLLTLEQARARNMAGRRVPRDPVFTVKCGTRDCVNRDHLKVSPKGRK